MTQFWVVLYIILGLEAISTEDLRLLDLPPEEAQQYIDNKDQTLKYAPKIESNVPAVRVLGKTPTNVLEDIYLANQYHGQDGLGSYLYGYSVPDIAKTERKKAHGDLKGAYQYINGDGQEIKVQYWDDGTGFHQTDNLPEVLPKQVEDSPDVQAAKQEFFKRWHEEAERNTHPVAPTGPGPSQSGYEVGTAQQPSPSTFGSNQGQYQPSLGIYQSGQGQLNQPGQFGGQTSHGGSQFNPGVGGYPTGQVSSTSGQYGQTGSGQAQSGYPNQPGQIGGQISYGGSHSGSQAGGYPTGQASSVSSQYGPSGAVISGYPNQAGQGQYTQSGQIGGQTGPGGNQAGYQNSGYPIGEASSVSNQYGQSGYPNQAGQNGGSHSGAQASGYPGQYGQSGSGQNSPSHGGYQTGSSQSTDQGCCGENQGNYGQNQGGNEWEYKPSEEEKGPPRGFFYNFDYPVGIIVQKQGTDSVHKRESLQGVYTENKANFNEQLKNGASPDGSSQSGYQVHV